MALYQLILSIRLILLFSFGNALACTENGCTQKTVFQPLKISKQLLRLFPRSALGIRITRNTIFN